MIKFTFLFVCFIFTFNQAWSNTEPLKRFCDPVFEKVIVIRNVLYGTNKTQAGKKQNLYMDIYMPANDTMKFRPVIILAHGGYFLYGSKASFSSDCYKLAQAGYIAATIDYRLIDVEESEVSYKRATADAVNDMKAAVRFFRRDRSEEDICKADTANIFIGGYSAGAITSLHYAYANTPRDVYSIGGMALVMYMTIHGGVNGDSGNPGYSSNIRGVFNIAGSIHKANLLNANEAPLFSVHGTADDIVPFNVGKSGESGVTTEGSGLIHQRANQIGLKNKLHQIDKEGHFAYFDCPICFEEMKEFIYSSLKK